MASPPGNDRMAFEEKDFDDADLPPVEFKIEDLGSGGTPEEIIRAALEERSVETRLAADSAYGLVVIPAENSLYGFKYALSGSGYDIRFSPPAYRIFDGVIFNECRQGTDDIAVRDAFTPSQYSLHYAPLRRNLAILRNYLMTLYPPGADRRNEATLREMASRLGKALRGKTRSFTFLQRILRAVKKLLMKRLPPDYNRFLELANTPDRGIAFMHHFLRGQQPDMHIAGTGASQLPKDWMLLPLEESPFSSVNMARYSDAARMGQISAAMDLVTRKLGAVDDMTPRDKETSVEHAREILRKMRIIASGAAGEKQYDQMDTRKDDARNMLQTALSFQSTLADLAREDPKVLQEPLVMQASQAIGKLNVRVQQEEKAMLRQESQAPSRSSSSSSRQPERQQQQQQQEQQQQQQKSGHRRNRMADNRPKGADMSNAMSRLMQQIDAGLQHAAEMRRQRNERARQKAALSQQIGKHGQLQKTLSDSMSTMSRPKIHQVSLKDHDFVEKVKKLNAKEPEEIKKVKSDNQSLGPK